MEVSHSLQHGILTVRRQCQSLLQRRRWGAVFLGTLLTLFMPPLHAQPRHDFSPASTSLENEFPPEVLALAHEARSASTPAEFEPLIRRVLETLGNIDAYPLPRDFWALASMDPTSTSFPSPPRPDLEPRILDALSSEQVPLRLGALLVFHPQTYGPVFSPGFQNAVLAKLALQPAHADPRVHAATLAAVLRLGQMNRSPATTQRALDAWIQGLRSGSMETRKALLSWLGRPDTALVDWKSHPEWISEFRTLLKEEPSPVVGDLLDWLVREPSPLPPALEEESKATLVRMLNSPEEARSRKAFELTFLQSGARGNRPTPDESASLNGAAARLLKSTNVLARHAIATFLSQALPARNLAPPGNLLAQLSQDPHPLVRSAAFLRSAGLDTVDAPLPAQADLNALLGLLKTPLRDTAIEELLLALQRLPLRPLIQDRMLELLTECLSSPDTAFRRHVAGRLAAVLQSNLTLSASKPVSQATGPGATSEGRFLERLQLAVLKGVRDSDGSVRLAFVPRLANLVLASDSESTKSRIQLLQSLAASDPLPQCRSAAFLALLELCGKAPSPAMKTRAQTAALSLLDSPGTTRLLKEAGAAPDIAVGSLVQDRFRPNPFAAPTPPNPVVEALALKLTQPDTAANAAAARLLARMHRTQASITADDRTRAALRAAVLAPGGTAIRPILLPLLLEQAIYQNRTRGMAPGMDPMRARRFGLQPGPAMPPPARDMELALLALHGSTESEWQMGLEALTPGSENPQGHPLRSRIAEELYKAFTAVPPSFRGRIALSLMSWFPEGNAPHGAEIQKYWWDLITNPKTPEEELVPAIQFVQLTPADAPSRGPKSPLEPLLTHTNALVRATAYNRMLAPIAPGQPDGTPWTSAEWTALVLSCLKDVDPTVRRAAHNFLSMAGEYGQPNLLAKAPPAVLREIVEHLKTQETPREDFANIQRFQALLRVLEELDDPPAMNALVDQIVKGMADGPPGNAHIQWIQQFLNRGDSPTPRRARVQSYLREQLLKAVRSEDRVLSSRAMEVLNQIAMNGMNDDLRSVVVEQALKLLAQPDAANEVSAINALQPHLGFITEPKLLIQAFELLERLATNRLTPLRATALRTIDTLQVHQLPTPVAFEKRRFDTQLLALDDGDANLEITALESLTMHHTSVEDPDRLKTLLEKAEKRLRPGPQRIPASVLCAALLQRQGNHERAAQILEEALPDAEPGFPAKRLTMQLASVYEVSQKFEKAIEILERSRKDAPPNPGMHTMEDQQLLRLYRRTGRQAEATSMLSQNLSPSNVHQLIADALNRKDPDAVLKLVERLLAPPAAPQGPFGPGPQVHVFSLMSVPRRLAAASTNHLERLTAMVRGEVERQPGQQPLQQLLLECFDAAGDHAAAMAFTEQALKSNPSPLMAARLAGAYARDPKLEAEARMDRLSKAAEQYPGQPAFRKELALCLARIGRLDEARATFQEIVTRNLPLAPDEMAETHLALGDFKEALEVKDRQPAEPAEPWMTLPNRWNRVRALLGQPPTTPVESQASRQIRQMGAGLPTDLPVDEAPRRIQALLESAASPQEKLSQLSQFTLPFSFGRWDLFFQPLESWANAHPEETWLPRALVTHCLTAQLPLKGLAWVERAERIPDTPPIAPDIKARLHWLAGNEDEALKWFQKATGQGAPTGLGNSDTLRAMVRFHLVRGDTSRALETYKRFQEALSSDAGHMGGAEWSAVQLGLAAKQVGALKEAAPKILELLTPTPGMAPMYANAAMSNPARHDALELAGRYREAHAERMSNAWWLPKPVSRTQEGVGKTIPLVTFQDLAGKRVDTADWKGRPTLVLVETLYAESNGTPWSVLSNLWQRIPPDRLRVVVLETPTSNLGTLRLALKESPLPVEPGFAPPALLEFLAPSQESIDYYLLDSQGRMRSRFGFSQESALTQEARALCLEASLPVTAKASALLQALTGPDELARSEAAYRLARWNGPLPVDALEQAVEKLRDPDRAILLPRLIEEAESSHKPEVIVKRGSHLLKANPNNYPRLNQINSALIQLGRRDQALKWVESTFSNALASISNQAAPPSVIAPVVMAYAHERLAPELAVRFASNAVQVAPGIGLAHQLLGRAMMVADRPAEALVALTRAAMEELTALESPAVSWSLLNELASVKSLPNDAWKSSIAKLRQAVDKTLADAPLARYLMADLLEALGNTADAQAYGQSTGLIPARRWTHRRIEHTSAEGEPLPPPPVADTPWKPIKAQAGSPVMVPFPPNPQTGGIGYYRAQIDRKAAGPIRLHIGSSSRLQLWMDGKVVFEQPARRQLQLDQDTVDLTLAAGIHEVVVAVVVDISTPPTAIPSAGNGFYLRIEETQP